MAILTYVQPLKDRVEQQRRTRLWLWYAPVMIVVGVATSAIMLIPLWILGIILFGRQSIGDQRLSGVQGEEQLVRTLFSLPDDYTILNQVHIPNARSVTGTTEIDAIAVGPQSIILLEAKNNGGTIVGGNEGDKEWSVRKVGRRGGVYSSNMRNPVRQARSQMHALREWLAIQGVKVYIKPLVVLTNPGSTFESDQNYSVPVVHVDHVIAKIREFGDGEPRDRGEVERARHALVELVQPKTGLKRPR
jgi:hypothetical protein